MLMKLRKRDGREVDFDKSKIQMALIKANENMSKASDRLKEDDIVVIANTISDKLSKYEIVPDVEIVQDLVETELCKRNKVKLFRHYAIYRAEHANQRNKNDLYSKIMSICNNNNDEVLGDNANKDPKKLSTQRDYMAGTISKEIYRNVLLPKDIVEAHDLGIIHQHDADYSIQKMTNCCLIDLIDMIWNGTKLNDIHIHRPHSFSTACTIATQCIVQIANSQFGGQTMSLAHLAPFVDISRQAFIKENLDIKQLMSEKDFNDKIEKLVAKEINKGLQAYLYQVLTISAANNGQTPFISVAMFRNDVDDVADYCKIKDKERLHKDFNLLVEEILNQRIDGVELEDGTKVSPVFPKLIYCIDSTNCDESTPNWYLTKLAAKCTAYRMVPDYVSEKVMIQLRGIKPYKQELESKFGIDHFGNIVNEEKFTKYMLSQGFSDKEIKEQIKQEKQIA